MRILDIAPFKRIKEPEITSQVTPPATEQVGEQLTEQVVPEDVPKNVPENRIERIGESPDKGDHWRVS